MKNSFIPFIAAAFLMAAGLPASAQMTDSQVISYIKKAAASGKDKKQIARELFEKGVREEQITRLYEKYASSSSDIGYDASSSLNQGVNRGFGTGSGGYGAVQRSRTSGADFTSQDAGGLMQNGVMQNGLMQNGVMQNGVMQPGLMTMPDDSTRIFGQDMFVAGGRLSFEPNENAATPRNYVIGPGDEIVIDVWGTSEASISQTVSPEGRIMIPQIGPVQLSGLTIEQATGKLKGVLSRKYSISGQQISVTLGKIRTIRVNVLGEVKVPGTYRLSAFSTVFNALYRAGGVTPVGSLRTVNVMRGGKFVGSADLYAFIFEGGDGADISLQEGDAIVVPPYGAVVEVTGGVRRPMRYEARPGEGIDKILEYAGSFTSDASSEEVTVERRDASGGSAFLVGSEQFPAFGVKDGDRIYVHTNAAEGISLNRVEVRGSVVRPGVYAIGDSLTGVRAIVEHAGGLLDEAFLGRAQIVREKPDRSTELIAVAIGSIMDGSSPDVQLRRNDVITIYDKNRLEPKGDLTINGYVNIPGDYAFAEGMTIEDLILVAGGLQSGASTVRVDVSRRIDDPSGTTGSTTLAEVFSFGIRDGMMVDGTPDFTLKPFDIVYVRKSPVYLAQSQVTVSGEVAFPGQYTLVSSNERVSDLIRRAGGLVPTSYASGATLRRRQTQSDRNLHDALFRTADNKADSLAVEKMDSLENYGVGIDLARALANPGSDDDVVLRDGDILIVPAYSSVVSIEGEVLCPNAVAYVTGKNVAYYVDQAGGFGEDARRSKVYVVHMNGHIEKGMGASVTPGSVVMVPKKPERRKMTVAEWLGIGTTAASLTTMIVTIANLIKK